MVYIILKHLHEELWQKYSLLFNGSISKNRFVRYPTIFYILKNGIIYNIMILYKSSVCCNYNSFVESRHGHYRLNSRGLEYLRIPPKKSWTGWIEEITVSSRYNACYFRELFFDFLCMYYTGRTTKFEVTAGWSSIII